MIELSLLAIAPIKWIVTLIAIDVFLGIVAAILKKEFRLGKVANFMAKPVVGYVFGYSVLDTVAQSIPSFAIIVQIAFALIMLALMGSILSNAGKLGIMLPNYLKK